MTSFRIGRQGEPAPAKTIRFSFDGKDVTGLEGDTIASALLANDIAIVGRSFKYHRPRGVWGAGVEEPNAIVDIDMPSAVRNARATTTPALDGMVVRSVNAHPTAATDRHAFLDRFARFIPSAFYYKTFMWPDWHWFEPNIRKMAGLGILDPTAISVERADQVNEECDLLVIGGGPAGLFAARTASEKGKKVIICDDGFHFGGSLLHRQANIDGGDGPAWIAATLNVLRDRGVQLLARTTAFGLYDHGLVALNEIRPGKASSRLWRVRPTNVLLATGAIERPLPFANNDLPGVMSAEAGLSYLRRHGIAVGRRVVLATNNGVGVETSRELADAGIEVTLVDYRSGRRLMVAEGSKRVAGVKLSDGTRVAADAVLVSGGFTPTLHLFGQAKGKLRWDDDLLTFVAGDPVPRLSAGGAAAGSFGLTGVFESTARALASFGLTPRAMPKIVGRDTDYGIVAAWPEPNMSGRVWIDLQHDVTTKDIELAARENFVSVEHLKRYTTLGMATDQGKTSNLNGLALMAQLTEKAIPEVGTTTYRPPFTPVPFTSLAGVTSGSLMNPPRRLVLENEHFAAGANLREYGGWLRPAWYGAEPEATAINREVRQARDSVALFDASPLGKIEVLGPQAAEFMDFVYYNTMSTLKAGRCRYGFMLSESGIVYDDGVLVRLEENRFIVSCSSSHVPGVYALLEEWRQDRFDRKRLFIHNTTADTATLTVSGPKSRALLEAVGLGIDLGDKNLPHMATAWGSFGDDTVRISRVSFTGDRSYEISIRADRAKHLWKTLRRRGEAFNATLLGLEALMVLRAEKGFIVIGKDSDGMTRPMDLGASAPLAKKTAEFIGKRSLFTEEAQRPDRNQLVGLEVVDGTQPFAIGSHGVESTPAGKRSLGYVTSSYFSATLNRPIALGLIERGAARHGEEIDVQHLGQIRRARLVPPCVFDPSGDRLNG
ncbi:FAD-dependent oxidoreductase [Mesorhizobium sp. CGMCC 1.15528]|uniref:FAD-dependent oxidoreductase n=1 Tax=Mesorhizobium zhangyense TaxID=1776730 RepID=A0A7C9V4H2_9HYPH|nr:2Fe-2S iron-sulfur cluster-binding protein [Mesorhizobium zhangyense]NGN40405.1 FAD-dependent oxidoreductase [Mesorhizobium zhangyense]